VAITGADRGRVAGGMHVNSATRHVMVTNPEGLHARPAHAIVNLAKGFQSDIAVIRNGESVDGKSILSILTLAAVQGTELVIKATGDDAQQALDALEELFRGEEDEADHQKTTTDG